MLTNENLQVYRHNTDERLELLRRYLLSYTYTLKSINILLIKSQRY